MMLNVWPYFIYGVGVGALLSFTWKIHVIGKIIIMILLLVSVSAVMVGGMSSFVAAFNPWQCELAQFLGIMVGSPIGRHIAEEMKSEF